MDQALEVLLRCPAEYRHWEWGHLLYLCHRDRLSVRASTNDVVWVAFSPQGDLWATRDTAGVAKVWETDTGRERFAGGDWSNRVEATEISPDDQHLAMAFSNRTLVVRRSDTWGESLVITNLPATVTHLAFLESPGHGDAGSPSATEGWLLAAACDDGTLIVWNQRNGRERYSIPGNGSNWSDVFPSADRRRLILRTATEVIVRRAEDGAEQSRFAPEMGSQGIMYASPQGEPFASMDVENRLTLWRHAADPLELGRIQGKQPGLVRRVFFSPSGRWLCSAGEAASARVYSAHNGKEQFALPGRVHTAAFSGDDRFVATIGPENFTVIWEVESGREVTRLRGHNSVLSAISLSADGNQALTADQSGIVKLWNVTPGRERLRDRPWVWGATISHDGRRIAMSPGLRGLMIWDANSGRRLLTVKAPLEHINAIAFSPDDRRVATAGWHNIARIFDAQTGERTASLVGHQRMIESVHFSPIGDKVATGGRDRTVRIWDAHNGNLLRTLDRHDDEVPAVMFSPEGQRLVTASHDGRARIWDISSGDCLVELHHDEAVLDVAYSPNGSWLATSSWDRKMHLWDTRRWMRERVWNLRGPAHQLVFSPDGRRLATASSRQPTFGYDFGTLEIWDVETGRELASFQGHEDPCTSVDWSSDGGRLLTGSFDFTVRQWEAFPWREADYPGSDNDPFKDRIRSYADRYWQLRRDAETAPWPMPGLADERRVEVLFEPELFSPRDPKATAKQLDLRPFHTAPCGVLSHPVHTADQADNHLGELPQGVHSFAGDRKSVV